MPCLNPKIAKYRDGGWKFTPERFMSTKALFRDPKNELLLPCKKCIECAIARNRDWATRICAEASLYENNRFVTLTYDNAHLPEGANIKIEDVQKFMKRLRKRYHDIDIRSFGCAEYGDRGGRPHYHIMLFNIAFEDEVPGPMRTSFDGAKYRCQNSEILSDLWGNGYTEIGTVTFASAAYVAKYTRKKLIEGVKEREDGRERERTIAVSNRPGIGHGYLELHFEQTFGLDQIPLTNKVTPVPEYFMRKIKEKSEWAYKVIKDRRRENRKELTPEKLQNKLNRRKTFLEERLKQLNEKKEQYYDSEIVRNLRSESPDLLGPIHGEYRRDSDSEIRRSLQEREKLRV